MSDSYDMSGWDLFGTPFSTAPVRTATQRQPADRPQQKPSAASPAQSQKNPPLPSPQAAVTRHKQPAAQEPEPSQQPAAQNPGPATQAPISVPKEKAAPATGQAAPTEAVDSEKPASVPAQPSSPEPVQAATPKSSGTTDTQPAAPQKELELDLSSSSGAAPVPNQDDVAKRKAHEEAEAKRKAEWEAKQAAKKNAEEEAIQKLNAMSDADIAAAATKRISTDTERLTRRNMKECVAEHIKRLCKEDAEFARKTMHPRKNMIRCFKHINACARDFLKMEMENNGLKPEDGIYGGDVPDHLCYHWAEEYFNDPDAPEDHKDEEAFVPKPYIPSGGKASKTRKKKTGSEKKPAEPKNAGCEQLSLEGML